MRAGSKGRVGSRSKPTPGTEFDLVARALRNSQPECWHFGACAVATPEGAAVAAVGNPNRSVFLRSGAKPFQAISLLLAGAWETYDLSPADLALVCASHGGTSAHLERVQSLLVRGGYSASDLQCGAHPPLDEESRERLASEGISPTPLHNNCSGKHAGMLLTCRIRDLSSRDYLSPDHPLQRDILGDLALLCEVEASAIRLGVDGCSAPTFRVPLVAVARAYAVLAAPEKSGLDPERCEAIARIVASLAEAPEMVAGPGRFTTRLLEVTRGRVLGKEGAQGFYGVALRQPRALGLALKIADGSDVCRDAVVVELLRQLRWLTPDEIEALGAFHRPTIKNHRGLVVGEVIPEVQLVELSAQSGI